MLDLFTHHPRAVGETWGEHRAAAWSYAGPLALAAAACLVHGLLPFLFERTASRTIATLNARLGRRLAAAPPHAPVTLAIEPCYSI